jgi:hypothetical protein
VLHQLLNDNGAHLKSALILPDWTIAIHRKQIRWQCKSCWVLGFRSWVLINLSKSSLWLNLQAVARQLNSVTNSTNNTYSSYKSPFWGTALKTIVASQPELKIKAVSVWWKLAINLCFQHDLPR